MTTRDEQELAQLRALAGATSEQQRAQMAHLLRAAPPPPPSRALEEALAMQNAHPQWSGPEPKPPSAPRRFWWRVVRAFWA